MYAILLLLVTPLVVLRSRFPLATLPRMYHWPEILLLGPRFPTTLRLLFSLGVLSHENSLLSLPDATARLLLDAIRPLE